jgi:hypothetical protein
MIYQRIAQLIYESLSMNEGSRGVKRTARQEAAKGKAALKGKAASKGEGPKGEAPARPISQQTIRLAYRGKKGKGAPTQRMSPREEGQRGMDRYMRGIESRPASSYPKS